MDGKGKNRLMEQRTMVGWTDRWVEGIRVEWNIIKQTNDVWIESMEMYRKEEGMDGWKEVKGMDGSKTKGIMMDV